MENISDKDILKNFRDESTRHAAFDSLVISYRKRIYWHIRRMVLNHDDADDLVQDTFIKIWNSLADFREDSVLFTWIYRIATNETLNFLRKKKLHNLIPFSGVEHSLSNSLKDDSYYSADEIQHKFQKALLTLPEKQRLVFNMRHHDELSYAQISEILGTSEGALKASFHIALKKVEKILTSG
ncbi:MAG: RNA polymerase sigma factor [Bacteroidota bacterium]